MRAILTWLLAGASLLTGAPSFAQTAQFPAKPVTVVVPSSAGGSVELQLRILADSFRERTGQSLLVVNRPGAMGAAGASFVYRAPPDGYTLLASPNSPMVFNPLTHSNLNYEPLKMTPIVLLGVQPLVMGVRGSLPAKTLQDLIAYAKAHPGKTYYGSQGVGGGNHMAAMLFGKHIGADLKHIPFPGAGPAGQALLKGEIDFFMAPLAVLMPWFRDGSVKILAMGSQHRAPNAPDVPTFKELGYPDDFILTVWSVIVGPAAIPDDVASRLNETFRDILAEPKVRERFAQMEVDPGGGSREDLAAMLNRETRTWTRVAQENEIGKQDTQ